MTTLYISYYCSLYCALLSWKAAEAAAVGGCDGSFVLVVGAEAAAISCRLEWEIKSRDTRFVAFQIK